MNRGPLRSGDRCEHGAVTTAAELAATLDGRLYGADVAIVDVAYDSRHVEPGALFCCVRGAVSDGHEFATDARDAGASALLVDHELDLDIPQIVVGDVRVAMSAAAAEVSGRPADSLSVIGVTGTNGKTTVVSMLGAILAADDRRVESIGTLTGERTTPESPDLQRQLARHRDAGGTDVAMEVSSHALALHRVDHLRFRVAVFTNLGLDHLDYHETQEAYFAAKASLFEPDRCDVAVINVDDVHGRLLARVVEVPVIEVSLDDATEVVSDAAGSTLRWRGQLLRVPVAGRHNISNALAAAAAAVAVGVDEAVVAAGLAEMPVVPGRFETIDAGEFSVVVDFAHTPEALEEILTAAAELSGPNGRLGVVFGCGGDRDRAKRPLMGEIACRLADLVVLTDDNPRSEDPSVIIEEILRGCEGERPTVLRPRDAAITTALQWARPGDIVLIAGKGHERGQVFGDRIEPFDDRQVALDALAQIDAAS